MYEWNDDHYFTKKEKAYFVFCGIVCALCISWVTYIAFEYREARVQWESTFTTPEQFWIIEDR